MSDRPVHRNAGARSVPDNTAARTALWRAMHVQVDELPHVLADEIGIRLLDPPDGWQDRRDMDRVGTARNRASMVARARYVEDLLGERSGSRRDLQYAVLGAGLDSYAQRHPDTDVVVFEVDQPDTQHWKRQRLQELHLPTPDTLRFVPFDFESAGSWAEALESEGLRRDHPVVIASLGVSMYLTQTAVRILLSHAASLADDATLVLSFLIPLESVDQDEQGALRGAARGAQANGTPWISFYEPAELVALARDSGFAEVEHVGPGEMEARYFANRNDGLRPSSAEHLIVASTR